MGRKLRRFKKAGKCNLRRVFAVMVSALMLIFEKNVRIL